jgi:hypothetical protein
MCEGRSETATLEFRSGISWEGSRRGVEEEGVWNSRKRTSSAPGILVLQQQRRQQQEKEE